MSPYEVVMLLCFGLSWPFSTYRTWNTKNSAGKSLIFLCFVLLGYVCGCIHKVLYSPDWVIALYALNGLMVLLDLILSWRYRVKETAALAPQSG